MEITVPIYVRVLKQASGTTYVGSPLLQEMTPVRGPDLGRMLARLGTELRRKLTELSRLPMQDSLLAWHEPQRLRSEVLSLFLRIQNQRVPFNILAVKWHRQGKQVIQLPVFPSLWFELGEDESLASRTTEVLQRYVLDRLSDDSDFDVRRESLSGRAWVESLCLSIPKLSIRKPQKRSSLAALFAGEVTDGADQLHLIGRCLDTMDLDELAEPLGVTPLLDRLQLEFNATDRHGVVLVGPAGSGKTALIEGWVRRRRQHELRPRLKKLLFELSASRLCSGWPAHVPAKRSVVAMCCKSFIVALA